MASYVTLLEMPGTAAPAVSPANRGRIYYDLATQQFMHSDNGAAYAAFATFPAFNGANRVLGINSANTGVEWKSSLLASIGTTGQVAADVVQPVNTTGSPRALRVTGGAHTTLTASTEAPDVDLVLARTVQFATGALTAQRAVKVTAPTYGFVAASTISDAATVAISGAPVLGANATFTRSFALWIETGAFGLGAAAARSGDIRLKHAITWIARNSTDAADIQLMDWGATTANILMIGNTADTINTIRIRANTVVEFYVGSALRMQVEAAALHFHDGTNANYSLRANGEQMIGFNIAAAGVRNIAYFNNGSAAMNGMDGGFYFLDVIAAPTANPAGGGYMWSAAGAGTWRGSAGTITVFGPA